MTTTIIAGFIVSIIFTFLSLVHFYWALFENSMQEFVIPEMNNEKVFTPTKASTLFVSFGLMLFAFIILGHIGVFELILFEELFEYGTWLIGFIFIGRAIGDFKFVGFSKKIKGTKFAIWDTRLYAPLCLFIAALTFLVIFSNTPLKL